MSRIVQYFADKAKTIKEYPIVLAKCIYTELGERLDNIMITSSDPLDADLTNPTPRDADTLGGLYSASDIATLNSNLTALENKGMKLLWTNPNPTSDFSAQTITVSELSNYKMIAIDVRLTKNTDEHFVNMLTKGIKVNLFSIQAVNVAGYYLNMFSRYATWNSNSIEFTTCTNGKIAGAETCVDGCVPYKIYGIC